MDHIYLERQFEPYIDLPYFRGMARRGMSCFSLYRVQWLESLMATDGSRLLCHFQAPDTESVRMISRDDRNKTVSAWRGSLHDARDDLRPNVVVERSWSEPVELQDLQARENEHDWCLETHQVNFVRTFFRADQKRMLCLYAAPDAESVRLAQQQAGMPMDRVWACNYFDAEIMGRELTIQR